MEKIKVNNQIVSMRKIVKQAKLYIINKLVKQRKALQMKKGTDAQLEKNKRKEERLGAEINIIKKIPVDEVSRKSLLQLKDWKTVLSSKTASLEERAFALLANFEPLQTEVKSFIEEHPNLVHLLPDFYEEWNQKKADPMRQEAKRMKALELKLKRKERWAKLRNQLNPKSQFDDKFKRKPKAGEGNRQKNKNNVIKSDLSSVTAASNETSMDMQNSEDSEEKSNEIKCMNPNLESDVGSEILPSESSEILAPKQKKRKEIAVLTLHELQDQESLKTEHASESEDDSNSENTVETDSVGNRNVKKDPFFVSADEPFDTNVEDLNSVKSSLLSSYPEKKNQYQKNQYQEKKNQRQNFHASISDSYRKKPIFNNKRDFKGNFQKQKFQHSGRLKEPQRKPFLNRGVKPNFPFQDKRNGSKFSESRSMNSKSLKSPKSLSSANKNLSFESSKTSAEIGSGLHPSWEAKRKLKQQTSQLLPFQGKKITFE